MKVTLLPENGQGGQKYLEKNVRKFIHNHKLPMKIKTK